MRLVFMLMLPWWLWGAMLQVGDAVTPLKLTDQFDAPYTLGNERYWVVTWDRMTTRMANRYFEQHPKMAAEGDTAMIVDVSQTPSGIMSLFVLPRMRSYEHRILLGYDAEYNRRIPYKDGYVTVLHLVSGKIESIIFAEDSEELDHIFQ